MLQKGGTIDTLKDKISAVVRGDNAEAVNHLIDFIKELLSDLVKWCTDHPHIVGLAIVGIAATIARKKIAQKIHDFREKKQDENDDKTVASNHKFTFESLYNEFRTFKNEINEKLKTLKNRRSSHGNRGSSSHGNRSRHRRRNCCI